MKKGDAKMTALTRVFAKSRNAALILRDFIMRKLFNVFCRDVAADEVHRKILEIKDSDEELKNYIEIEENVCIVCENRRLCLTDRSRKKDKLKCMKSIREWFDKRS